MFSFFSTLFPTSPFSQFQTTVNKICSAYISLSKVRDEIVKYNSVIK